MRRALPGILAGLLALALVGYPTGASLAFGSDTLEEPGLLLPEERDAFGLTAPKSAPHALEPLPVPRFTLGSVLGLGFDVGQFRLVDPGTTVSFDLKLSWPGVPGASALEPGALQPYVSLGPALFMAEPRDATSPAGPRGDPTLAVGVKAGAGVSWQLDRDAALFSEYRITRGSNESLGPLGVRSSGEVSGFDVLYGLRLRF